MMTPSDYGKLGRLVTKEDNDLMKSLIVVIPKDFGRTYSNKCRETTKETLTTQARNARANGKKKAQWKGEVKWLKK